MHLFHKWSRWSDPEPAVKTWTQWGVKIGEPTMTMMQQRTCEKCGKSEKIEA